MKVWQLFWDTPFEIFSLLSPMYLQESEQVIRHWLVTMLCFWTWLQVVSIQYKVPALCGTRNALKFSHVYEHIIISNIWVCYS